MCLSCVDRVVCAVRHVLLLSVPADQLVCSPACLNVAFCVYLSEQHLLLAEHGMSEVRLQVQSIEQPQDKLV